MESQFNDLGDMHFIALESSNHTASNKTPMEKLLQNEEGTNEPMPYFALNKESLAVTFHCPLKYGYTKTVSYFLGFAKMKDLAFQSGENIGSLLSAKVNENGYKIR